jgi:hypothetical protein
MLLMVPQAHHEDQIVENTRPHPEGWGQDFELSGSLVIAGVVASKNFRGHYGQYSF